jgi:glycosyltransferase involved in cell wall biosynthesis
MDIKFSIIIPVYNVEEYISAALDSVLNQTYKNCEIICINDGSIDTSLKILNKYANVHENIIVIDKKNGGVSNARNRGISKCSGDYILFLDADDYYLSNNILYEFSQIINKNKNIECIYFPGGYNDGINAENKFFENKIYPKGVDCMNNFCRKKNILVFGSIYAQCFKRTVIMDYSLMFDEELSYGEDRLFTIKFFSFADVIYVYPNPVYFYRIRQGSLMTNPDVKKQISDADKFCNTLFLFCINNGLKKNEVMNYVNGLYVQNIISNYRNDHIIQIKLNLRLLFVTSKTLKRKLKSFALLLGVKLYITLFDI